MRYLLLPLACLLAVSVQAQRVYVEMNAMLGSTFPRIVRSTALRIHTEPQPAFMPGLDLNFELIRGALAFSGGVRGNLYGCVYSSATYRRPTADFVSTIGFPAKITYLLPVNDRLLYRFWVGMQPYIGVQYPGSNMHASIEAGTNVRLGKVTSLGLAWIRNLHNYEVEKSILSFSFIMAEVKFTLPSPRLLPRMRHAPPPRSPF